MTECLWSRLMDPNQLPGLYEDLALLRSLKGTARKTLRLPSEVAAAFMAMLLCMNLFMLCTWPLASGQYSLVAVVGIVILDCCATALGVHEYHRAVRIARDGEELLSVIEWQADQIERRIDWMEKERDMMKEKKQDKEAGQ